MSAHPFRHKTMHRSQADQAAIDAHIQTKGVTRITHIPGDHRPMWAKWQWTTPAHLLPPDQQAACAMARKMAARGADHDDIAHALELDLATIRKWLASRKVASRPLYMSRQWKRRKGEERR